MTDSGPKLICTHVESDSKRPMLTVYILMYACIRAGINARRHSTEVVVSCSNEERIIVDVSLKPIQSRRWFNVCNRLSALNVTVAYGQARDFNNSYLRAKRSIVLPKNAVCDGQ